jgi:hypothetical protein
MQLLRITAFAVHLSSLAVACSQSSSQDCPGTCPANQPAILELACGPSDLSSVTLSGSCASGDGNPSSYVFGAADSSLAIHSASPGACHVVLGFASGFTYSADVSFTQQTSGSTGCSCTYTTPSISSFMVDNPANTCLDAAAGPG